MGYNTRDDRKGYSVYIPENYHGSQWPLIMALHDGYGHGRDFIWTWLRQARKEKFFLVAPNSTDKTWSLLDPGVDLAVLENVLEYVEKRWRVDPERILLTGISDGETFSLVQACSPTTRFSAFSVIAGTLPPAQFHNTKERHVYWIHGVLDLDVSGILG